MSRHATTAGAVLLATGALVVTFAATADATPGHSKPSICHPVEGKGETGYGWNLIRPDEASKHIDEATGAGKHARKDGRTDAYADAAGHCPGFVEVVTPTPTPTATVTPSPEPTKSTPAPSPTVTATPEPTPTASTPGPVPTVTPTGSTPTPSATITPSPTTTPPAPTTSSPAPTVTPTTSSTTTPAPVAKKTTQPTGELAQTGAETWHLLSLGALLILIGAGGVAIARRNQFGNHS